MIVGITPTHGRLVPSGARIYMPLSPHHTTSLVISRRYQIRPDRGKYLFYASYPLPNTSRQFETIKAPTLRAAVRETLAAHGVSVAEVEVNEWVWGTGTESLHVKKRDGGYVVNRFDPKHENIGKFPKLSELKQFLILEANRGQA